MNDDANCGSCGIACLLGQKCMGGTCRQMGGGNGPGGGPGNGGPGNGGPGSGGGNGPSSGDGH